MKCPFSGSLRLRVIGNLALCNLISCCPSPPMFPSSDTGLFVSPLTPCILLLKAFPFFPQPKMLFPQIAIWLLKGELSLDLLSQPELPNYSLSVFPAFSSDLPQISMLINCYMFICLLSVPSYPSREYKLCEFMDLVNSLLYSWCLEMCLACSHNNS